MPEGADMTRNNRESAWRNIRLIELLYTVIFGALLILGLKFKFTEPVFWTFGTLASGLGGWIWWRQYQVLDEFGQLVFLKSWMANGIVTSTSVSLVLLRTLMSSNVPFTSGAAASVPVPIWWFYVCLIAGLVAMGLTNLYLRRSPSA
jgi:hypothetical protein